MVGYRKPSARPMPRRLYRFTTERRTSVNRYLLTVDFPWPRRNQPTSLRLSSPLSLSFTLRLLSSSSSFGMLLCLGLCPFSSTTPFLLFHPSSSLLSPHGVTLSRPLFLSLSLSLPFFRFHPLLAPPLCSQAS